MNGSLCLVPSSQLETPALQVTNRYSNSGPGKFGGSVQVPGLGLNKIHSHQWNGDTYIVIVFN